jgi:hypothetical protein
MWVIAVLNSDMEVSQLKETPSKVSLILLLQNGQW